MGPNEPWLRRKHLPRFTKRKPVTAGWSKPFQFHIGGYASPYPTVQKIRLKTKKNLNIAFNVADFLNQLNLVNQNKIMSPGKEAQELSEILSSLFYINEKE